MSRLQAVTRRAASAAFLLFAAALLVVAPAEASVPRSAGVDQVDAVALASLERPALGLASPTLEPSRFSLGEDLSVFDATNAQGPLGLCGLETSRCALTYARNNPLRFVDPDGRLVGLAPGLSPKEQRRITTALARSMRNSGFRQRFDTAVGSPILTTLGTKRLPNDFRENPGLTQGVINYGRTDPVLEGRKLVGISLNVDFGNIDFSKRTSQPVSDVTVIAHEFDHVNNMQSQEGINNTAADPTTEEENAGSFGESVGGDSKTKKKPTKEELDEIIIRLTPTVD